MLYNYVTFLNSTMSSSSSTVVTEDGGRQNIYGKEPQIEVIDPPTREEYLQNAERVNGWLAMIGFNAAVGAYIFTGQIFPGVF